MNLLKVATYAKALAAGVGAAGAVVSADLVANVPLGVGQWVTVVLAFLGGLGITYAVPNKPVDVPVAAVKPTNLP